MFCPECRVSWPANGTRLVPRVEKLRRNNTNPSEWGSPMICPNCKIPLAADRIEGEFPSVAHASSAKEGSMTIKDVLRETDSSGVIAGDVPLDDKKPEVISRYAGFKQRSKAIMNSLFAMPKQGPRGIIQRLAIVMFAICVSSIVVITMHEISSGLNRAKAVTSQVATKGIKETMPVDEQWLLDHLPIKVDGWVREESSKDLWTNDNPGGNYREYVATYGKGNELVKVRAVKVTGITSDSDFPSFVTLPRTVHAKGIGDLGIEPVQSDNIIRHVVFDYTPKNPQQSFWIDSSEFPDAHTISWIQEPYVMSIDASTVEDRRNFSNALLELKTSQL